MGGGGEGGTDGGGEGDADGGGGVGGGDGGDEGRRRRRKGGADGGSEGDGDGGGEGDADGGGEGGADGAGGTGGAGGSYGVDRGGTGGGDGGSDGGGGNGEADGGGAAAAATATAAATASTAAAMVTAATAPAPSARTAPAARVAATAAASTGRRTPPALRREVGAPAEAEPALAARRRAHLDRGGVRLRHVHGDRPLVFPLPWLQRRLQQQPGVLHSAAVPREVAGLPARRERRVHGKESGIAVALEDLELVEAGDDHEREVERRERRRGSKVWGVVVVELELSVRPHRPRHDELDLARIGRDAPPASPCPAIAFPSSSTNVSASESSSSLLQR